MTTSFPTRRFADLGAGSRANLWARGAPARRHPSVLSGARHILVGPEACRLAQRAGDADDIALAPGDGYRTLDELLVEGVTAPEMDDHARGAYQLGVVGKSETASLGLLARRFHDAIAMDHAVLSCRGKGDGPPSGSRSAPCLSARGSPNGSYPTVDSWGNKVCQQFGKNGQSYFDTSKGCP